jgi:hypothetical protein
MTIMVTELIVSTALFLAVFVQLLPRPTLKQQPVIVRPTVRNGNSRRPY